MYCPSCTACRSWKCAGVNNLWSCCSSQELQKVNKMFMLHMAVWHSGFSGVSKSFESSDSGYFAGSVMIPKSRVLLKPSQSSGNRQKWDSSGSFCLKSSSSSTRQLWKDLHNLFKRLKVAARTDLMENWHLCEIERLWVLQKDDVVLFAAADLWNMFSVAFSFILLKWGRDAEVRMRYTPPIPMWWKACLSLMCLASFCDFSPQPDSDRLFDLLVSLFPPPPYSRLLLADVAQP